MKIQCAINAARKRRITGPKFLEWMASLIDAVCLGNYYVRSFKYRNSHPFMIASEGMSSLPIPPSYRAAKRRRTIRTLIFGDADLRELHDTLKKLQSIDICLFIHMVNALPERPIRTYLYMDNSRLLNRDIERAEVMKFLFQPSVTGENNVDILPIVGSSGVGKTNLVLHSFYDPKVQNHFSLKVYVPYSNICYFCKTDGYPMIFEQILKRCNSTNIIDFDENTLVAMLKQNLSSERFLLVIDSIWDRLDFAVWNSLLCCLRCGKNGSKVILIAGPYECDYEKIINLGTMQPIILEGFSEDEYMVFFKEHAFGSTDPEDFPELEKMGRVVAKKMNGSIWGAKLLGELVRDNLNASFWSIFLSDGILSSKFLDRKDIRPVIDTYSALLPWPLPVKGNTMCRSEKHPQTQKLKSYRELMILGPNRCALVLIEGLNIRAVEILVTKHFFLNECTVITAICEPADD